MIDILLSQNVSPVTVSTSQCFASIDKKFNDSASLDKFFSNIIELNKIFTPDYLKDHPFLGSLAVLGLVSAVESYFRSIISNMILIDEFAAKVCEKNQIPYGSYLISKNQHSHILDSLLEGISFVSKKKIIESLASFSGFNQSLFQPFNIDDAASEFEKICELRHCVVHRFGYLGSKNIIALGRDVHEEHIGKVLSVSYDNIQQFTQACDYLVRRVNSMLFNLLIGRLAKNQKFSWIYTDDKKLFNLYVSNFYSTIYPQESSVDVREIYDKIKKQHISKSR